jgi:hypothetical protein
VFPPDELHASVDGKPLTDLESYRAISPEFSYTLPPQPDNVLVAAFGESLGNPPCLLNATTVDGAVADGFYVMLHPLSKGTHTINFGGSKSGSVALDMTYNITVG